MKYLSTRGRGPMIGFSDVVLAGLARDGGLYVPESWPRWDAATCRNARSLGYAELAARVLAAFAAPDFTAQQLTTLTEDAFGQFDHPDIAPLRQIGNDLYLLELFHGPTLAFKDYALQILGRIFDEVLRQRGERVTILGATSGDTGSAAIEACRDRSSLEVFILHPQGRVSAVQRRQMTTVSAGNIHNVAIDGTFDDCQDLVKALFSDGAFRDRWRLSAVNSINWARIAAQVAYYIYAAIRLGAPDRPVAFAVPTGNFGNVFAGWSARQMGIPIAKLIIGSNKNDILTRFFATGRMAIETVCPTLSPSMDIQVSSNFERYLFEILGRDAAHLTSLLTQFRERGSFTVDEPLWQRARADYIATSYSDEETMAVIGDVFARTGILIDPHTAIGIAAGGDAGLPPGTPVIAIATAHPAKFPDPVERATGIRPELPSRLADLFERPEYCVALPNDIAGLKSHIASVLTYAGVSG